MKFTDERGAEVDVGVNEFFSRWTPREARQAADRTILEMTRQGKTSKEIGFFFKVHPVTIRRRRSILNRLMAERKGKRCLEKRPGTTPP